MYYMGKLWVIVKRDWIPKEILPNIKNIKVFCIFEEKKEFKKNEMFVSNTDSKRSRSKNIFEYITYILITFLRVKQPNLICKYNIIM